MIQGLPEQLHSAHDADEATTLTAPSRLEQAGHPVRALLAV